MQKTVVIMAAGMGSRYGGLKQLDQIGPSGETIIDYAVYDAIRAGFSKVVFIIRDDFEKVFKDRIGSKFTGKVEVEYVYQRLEDIPKEYSVPEGREKPWGTGHAMLTAAPVTKDPFIIINADDFYGQDAFVQAATYLDGMEKGELKAALAGFFLKNTLSVNGTVSRGICEADKRDLLINIEENHGIYRDSEGNYLSDNRTDLTADTIVSMNMWAFSPVVFEYAEKYFRRFLESEGTAMKSEFYIPLIVNTLIEEEKLGVEVLKTESEWHGVTYKEDKPEITKAVAAYIEAELYPSNLWG